MLSLCLVMPSLMSPLCQEGPGAPATPPAESRERTPAGTGPPAEDQPPFEVGPNGWPIPRDEWSGVGGGLPVRTDFAPDPPTGPGPVMPPPAPGGAGSRVQAQGSAPGWRPRSGRSDPAGEVPLDSPLRDVFRAVRLPADLRALGGVTLWLQVSIYDPLGEEIGSREVTHEADLGHSDRDRLMYADGRVYGRLGGAVYARRNRRPWPTLQDEAREELELMGILARAPWVFAESGRFSVFSAEYGTWGGRDFVRIRAEKRPAAGDALGAQRLQEAADRFALLCDPVTYAPQQLEIRWARTGVTRRVLLDDYRELGGVRYPFRRTVVVEGDRPALVMRVVRVETGQRFREEHFRLR